jgi:hypothetical protein
MLDADFGKRLNVLLKLGDEFRRRCHLVASLDIA